MAAVNSNFTEEYCAPEENITFLNVTIQYPIEYARPLYGFVSPILCGITLVVNTIVIIVLSQRHMRSPTNLVLLATAVSDTLTVLFSTPWSIYMYTFGNHDKLLYPIEACTAFRLMTEVFPNSFHTSSIWLTLLLALQRYICVKYPLLAKSWITKSRVLKTILIIFFAAFLHQLSRVFDRNFTSAEIEWDGNCYQVCRENLAYWVTDIMTVDVYFNIYFWFRVIFVHFIPCSLLLYLTCSMTIAIYRSHQIRAQLFREASISTRQTTTQQNFNSSTIMLIVAISVFLLAEVPLAVLTILHIISSSIVEFLDYEVVNVFIIFSNLFIECSFPINFFIYYGMSENFRQTCKQLFKNKSINTGNASTPNCASESTFTINSVVTSEI